jgi:branched-chain amino acid transport system permease protein
LDLSIASILTLDGGTNGAIYALLALALVLVFAITRVIFIPQGEYVAYGALTLAMIQNGNPIGSVWKRWGDMPGTVWLLLVCAVLVAVLDALRSARLARPARVIARSAIATLAIPVVVFVVSYSASPRAWPLWGQGLLTLAIVTPLGPLVYRLAYEKLADATVLVLLIVSVGVHFALTGLGLVFFGAEGFRNPSFWDARFSVGALTLSGQTVIIFLATVALMAALYLFFERTLRGKALRATAVNRLGARLMGISTTAAGQASFGLAAFIGALSGLLIGPTTTMFYDSGFLIGLKGFVAAIFGGLASYPAAVLGAVFVGLLESFGSFFASAFKEVIVFTLIIPVLLWRSFLHGQHDDEE